MHVYDFYEVASGFFSLCPFLVCRFCLTFNVLWFFVLDVIFSSLLSIKK